MGFLDNLFNDGKKKSGGDNSNNSNNNKNNNNNPLANIRKNIEQGLGGKRTMQGPGRSLGGSKPGTVYQIALEQPGPVGIKVEKRSNTSASAIVNSVVPGSQAEAAGLRRGDVLCFAGSNGQEEMPYNMFLEIVKSPQRPIHLEARRFEQSSARGGGGSADAEARRRAMIAAAEAREKKHKRQTKTIKYVTKSTLLKQQQQQQQQLPNASVEPQSEASRRAAVAAKQGEAHLAAELGYNPYEPSKKTAGQARATTITTQHGAITAPGGGSGGGASDFAALPVVAPPRNATTAEHDDNDDDGIGDPRFHDFEVALAMVASSSDSAAAKSGLKIARTLIKNATTKGQQSGGADAEKFRRVRLANPKIRAAIVDVPGNLDLMLSVGFVLQTDDSNADESLLVFPPADRGPKWLSRALKAMEETEAEVAIYT